MAGFTHLVDEHDVRPDIGEAFEREWKWLQRPGTYFSSPQKLAVMRRTRAAVRGAGIDDDLPQPVAAAVDRIATAPAQVRRGWVEALVAAGLPLTGYVETLSLVSRIMAVDAFHEVAGLAPPELPDPGGGAPTGDFNPMARPSKGFVPMTRGTSIWWSLTLVPEAYARMEDLHCVLYLSPEQMQAPGSPRRLSRPQMELIASRTSAVNECFY